MAKTRRRSAYNPDYAPSFIREGQPSTTKHGVRGVCPDPHSHDFVGFFPFRLRFATTRRADFVGFSCPKGQKGQKCHKNILTSDDL